MGKPTKSSFALNAKERELITNALYDRQTWLRRWLNNDSRDIDKECGHPEEITIYDYVRAYKRGDIAARVVNLLPEESWKKDPIVYDSEDENESPFEQAWKKLNKKLKLTTIMQRADTMSGIGRFGIILIGINDNQTLDKPVKGINPDGTVVGTNAYVVQFLRCFDEAEVLVKTVETDLANPRYGQPVHYTILFSGTSPMGITELPATSLDVHWTRVIHVCDNRLSSDVYGEPRLKRVYDRIIDLRKIMGGSGEMFWRGGFPGLSIETQPRVTGEELEFDEEKTKDAVENYQRGMKRYLALVGMSAKSLAPQISDPTNHANMQISLICVAWSVPMRVFMGSERGQLASSQDSTAWNDRIERRQNAYLTPYLITPLIERLIAYGALPPLVEEEIYIEWPELNEQTPTDASTVANNITNAMAKYVQSGTDILMSPFHFLTLVLKLTDDEADSVIAEVEHRLQQNEEVATAQADRAIQDAKNPPEPAPTPFARNKADPWAVVAKKRKARKGRK
jgi:uncharacterized protein